MNELQSRTIDGVLYEISQFPLEKQQKIFHKLTRLISPSVGGMIGAFANLFGKEEGVDLDQAVEDLNFDQFGKAFSQLFASLDEKEAPILTRELCDGPHLLADKKKISYDIHFQQRGLAHLYKVCFAIVEVNYKDFLSDIRDGIKGSIGRLLPSMSARSE